MYCPWCNRIMSEQDHVVPRGKNWITKTRYKCKCGELCDLLIGCGRMKGKEKKEWSEWEKGHTN